MNSHFSKCTIGALCSTLILTNIAIAADEPTLTRGAGAPVGDNQNSLTAGPSGPTLLEDNHLIEKLASFDRERIPERVVHARGTGAEGVFKATADLSDITALAPLQKAGKETPVLVRFSTVIHSSGSPETLRDPHGFAVKFYSDQGNWDLVGNNFPVFFIRDAIKFPDMVHSLKPDPKTNVQDPNRFFDFFSFQPESTHMLTHLYSPLGIPTSYREMNGAGVHAYKLVNDQCARKYVKFTWKSQQGNKGMTMEEASAMQAKDFNYLTNDLHNNIEKGNYPVWDLYIQTIDPTDIPKFDFNILDATKIWPEDQVPARKVGELTLNKVPDNFFQTTEQAAFAPSNMIPGIEASEDKLLQGRLFSYADTQRYRLGANHLALPVNAPKVDVHNHEQNGEGYSHPQTSQTNYQPSRTGEGFKDDAKYKYCEEPLNGNIQQKTIQNQQNFKQAGDLYRSFSKADQDALINAFAADLVQVQNAEVRNIITSYLYKADTEYGTRVGEKVNANMEQVKKLAANYQN
jgi:catalase